MPKRRTREERDLATLSQINATLGRTQVVLTGAQKLARFAGFKDREDEMALAWTTISATRARIDHQIGELKQAIANQFMADIEASRNP